MKENRIEISYKVYDDINELPKEDAWLLNEARDVTKNAYAPYSNFHVGAVAGLVNGEIVTATNQENASYPAGICAERVLLSSAASQHPNVAVQTIAVSYNNMKGKSNTPISPCGICRQSLVEYQQRTQNLIRIILGGMEGKIFIIEDASQLLPLAFSSQNLK